jgi:hypothetical protein
MEAIISSPNGTYKLNISSLTPARTIDFDSIFGAQNYINGLFYFQPMNSGNNNIPKYIIGVEKNYRASIPILYQGKGYSIRANGIVYLLIIVKNKEKYILDRMMILKATMPVINEKVKAVPIPLPNVWSTGFACLGSINNSVKTETLSLAVDYFINQFWLTVFRNDLRETINLECPDECKSEKEYLSKLTRKSRSDIEFMKGNVDRFIEEHSWPNLYKKIDTWIHNCVQNIGGR